MINWVSRVGSEKESMAKMTQFSDLGNRLERNPDNSDQDFWGEASLGVK